MKRLSRIWSSIVNAVQWYNYAKSWLNIFFNMLTITSSVSILLIFFNAERNLETLLLFNVIVFGGALILGNFLFRSKAQQIDNVMLFWRTPYFALANTSINMAIIELAKRENVTIPKELGEWGVKQWADVLKIYKYSLEKGKEAQSLQICQDFFERS